MREKLDVPNIGDARMKNNYFYVHTNYRDSADANYLGLDNEFERDVERLARVFGGGESGSGYGGGGRDVNYVFPSYLDALAFQEEVEKRFPALKIRTISFCRTPWADGGLEVELYPKQRIAA